MAEDKDKIKKRAEEFEKTFGKGQRKVKEKGIEELDLEDAVPGGSYLAAATPVGLGKTAVKKALKEMAEAGVEAAGKKSNIIVRYAKDTVDDAASRKAKRAAEKLDKLEKAKESGEKLSKHYSSEVSELRKKSKASENEAPTLDYLDINKIKQKKESPSLDYRKLK